MATSTVEDYLKCIFTQQSQEEGLVSMGRIGRELGVAPGTVTAMVKTLAESGLLDYEPYSGVRLTTAGERLATHVLRRHRLIELFLVEVVGLGWSEVHEEAELLEHAVSERLIDRIDELLGRPSSDPHGDPIPDRSLHLQESLGESLLQCECERDLRVVRVRDQSPAFLRLLEERGLTVGAALRVRSRDETSDSVALALPDGTQVTLGLRAASKIQVAPQGVLSGAESRG